MEYYNQPTKKPVSTLKNNTGVPFDNFKKSLGQTANKYTDEQIEQMRLDCDKIADLVFDAWLKKRNAA